MAENTDLIPVVNKIPVCPVCARQLEDRRRCSEGHIDLPYPVPTPPGMFCEMHFNFGCWEDKLDCWQAVHGTEKNRDTHE